MGSKKDPKSIPKGPKGRSKLIPHASCESMQLEKARSEAVTLMGDAFGSDFGREIASEPSAKVVILQGRCHKNRCWHDFDTWELQMQDPETFLHLEAPAEERWLRPVDPALHPTYI